MATELTTVLWDFDGNLGVSPNRCGPRPFVVFLNSNGVEPPPGLYERMHSLSSMGVAETAPEGQAPRRAGSGGDDHPVPAGMCSPGC